ncbi:MAG TPA: formyltransferase family protein, partial [Gemmatimonadaceae bacterium]|nr:formyltransferase family protein [Gemmatimonadaceae bacterium]
MTRARIAVLASGGGTNLQAILDHFAKVGERRCGDVVVVASDRADAGALSRARARDIAVEIVAVGQQGAGVELEEICDSHNVELVALAGYRRYVPTTIVNR